MPFGGIGIWEVVLILLVVLLVFGPRRLPELGGALGKGIREFKRSVTDIQSELRAPAPKKDEIGPASSAQSAAPTEESAPATAEEPATKEEA